MIDIIGFLKGLISSNNRMQFIYSNIYSQMYILISRRYKIIGSDNAIYYLDKYFYLVDQAVNEYDYSDIRETDIVLDIGACVGGFTLEVHNKVDHVYAVEPIFLDELCANLRLNHTENVDVFTCALGESDTMQQISFVDKTISTPCKSLSEIIELCGGHVDVLKTDCEGGEWHIKPHELEGIRRIEAEVHSFNGEHKDDFKTMLQNAGYNVSIKTRSKTTMLLSARKSD
ncbi:MAG: FkbM family methyltransferase [Methanosarcinales archaeon]|nr:FkbM family methyltransferase [Methanosarcinales archaeon]